MSCFAYTCGSQTICAPCGLNWDTNDPEPPACRKIDGRSKLVKTVAKLQQPPVKKGLPDKLPDHLARQMEKAYKANGMGAAYRVLIDNLGE
jgi:hypothetical protein